MPFGKVAPSPRLGAVLVAVLAGTLFCGGEPDRRSAPLVVAAAVSLKAPLEEIARAFERRRAAVVRLSLGASGLLASQIERGAPVDVFASASAALVDRLARAGRILAGTRRDLCSNVLVLVVPAAADDGAPVRFADLVRLGRLALGNPRTVPAGAYARECLETLGLWEGIAGRVVFAEHARQAVDYVARGEVDGGLVYATDAALVGSRVRIAAEAPAGCHGPIRYEIAVVAGTERPGLAREFVALAAGPEGRAILAAHGFPPPP